MKTVQASWLGKIGAWLVLLAAAFGMGVFGIQTLLSLESAVGDSWQDSRRYYVALDTRRRELVEGVELVLLCQKLEERIASGEAGELEHADLEALQAEREDLEDRFSRENTWFRFRVLTSDRQRMLGSNLAPEESLLTAVEDVYTHTLTLQDGQLADGSYAGWYEGYQPVSPDGLESEEAETVQLVLEYGVPADISAGGIRDEFARLSLDWTNERAFFSRNLTGCLLLGVLTLAALLWILWTAGHRRGAEGIVCTWQERIFLDVYAVLLISAGVCMAFAAIWAAETVYFQSMSTFHWSAADYDSRAVYSLLGILAAAALCSGTAAAGALLLRTIAVRAKAGLLAHATLLYRVAAWTVRTVHEFVQHLPFTWKILVSFFGYGIVSFWLVLRGIYDGFFIMLYFFLQAALLLFLGWWAYGYYRLRQGTRTIAKGDLEYQIDTRRMPHDLRLQAEELNNISAGLAAAVDEKMKSERFKAELITNVSHDLKTPLTSIINYVNLLKSTSQTDPKAAEYIEVLDRKSQRLKKLTEDLVEASKASTGVLSVTREKIGMSQLIDQALGEWEERLSAGRLTLVTTLPEGETWVYADGRHLWRVIDNLLSNCSKYALESTRVYLDLARGKGQVTLSVKNISREALNVPPERLMERFVRGEDSRSTEGSGLGLSIARSLTELQGGSFDLAVDGDLFKAIVTLPQAN